MNIYPFKPTYLYIKQHRITGLKYFGKTTKIDPVKYPGSGKHWTPHIKKHGRDQVDTIWFQLFLIKEECTEYAVRFSIENNIVSSKEWANQMIEDGLTGNGSPGRIPSLLSREIVSANNIKRLANGTHIFADKVFQKENARKMIEAGTHPVYKLQEKWVCNQCGKTGKGLGQQAQHRNSKKCLEYDKPKETAKDRVTQGTHNFLGGELQKKRVANGSHPSQFPWTCNVCGTSGKGKGVFTRYHDSNCKSLVQVVPDKLQPFLFR